MVFRPAEFRTNGTGPKIEKDGYMAKKIARKTSLTKGVFVALLYLDRFVAIDLLRKSFYLWQNKSLALKSFLLACLPQLKNICLFKGPERRRKNGKGKKSCWNFWNNYWFSLDVIARVYDEWSIMHGKRLWELDGGATVRPKLTDCWK